jgi:hypothetical protein
MDQLEDALKGTYTERFLMARRLYNGPKLRFMPDGKGLEGFTFDKCLQQASRANIEGVGVPFLHINQFMASKKSCKPPQRSD